MTEHRPRGRRGTSVAVAALVAVACVLTACSGSGLRNPNDALEVTPTSPDTPGAFGYVLDVLPDGYEACAISIPSALSLSAEDPTASLRVYGDAALADPYEGPLIGVAVFSSAALDDLPLGTTRAVTLADGSAALEGGADGLQLALLPPEAGRVLTWMVDDGRAAQLIARDDDGRTDLVSLAPHVAVSDSAASIPPDALPFAEVADLGDLYQVEGQATFVFALDHQRTDDAGALDDRMTLFAVRGDEAGMESVRFRARSSERLQVNGRLAVGADLGADGDGPWVLTWADDGLILRLFSFALEPDALTPVAESARRVDGAAWQDLVEELRDDACDTGAP